MHRYNRNISKAIYSFAAVGLIVCLTSGTEVFAQELPSSVDTETVSEPAKQEITRTEKLPPIFDGVGIDEKLGQSPGYPVQGGSGRGP